MVRPIYERTFKPSPPGFEIIGVRTEKADRYSFHVILYELAMAAPSGDSYGSLFDLVRQGDEWKVDELPKSFELPAPRPFESKH